MLKCFSYYTAIPVNSSAPRFSAFNEIKEGVAGMSGIKLKQTFLISPTNLMNNYCAVHAAPTQKPVLFFKPRQQVPDLSADTK